MTSEVQDVNWQTSDTSESCHIAKERGLKSITSLGGGHGLFQTLRAARILDIPDITAVVTVADDGGSSGRIRNELGHIPPGDLRMAIAALSRESETGKMWEETLQHRFGGSGALAGHAVGNLLIAGLTDILGSQIKALDTVCGLTESHGRVLPVVEQPLNIEAEVAGLGEDPRIMRLVRGQVAVATTPGHVRRVRLMPENPTATPEALAAIRRADVVTLGPGSWFTSVIPHLLVPEVVEAVSDTDAMTVAIVNLSSNQRETTGFSVERHIHMLAQHAPRLRLDKILVDTNTITNEQERAYLARAAATLNAEVVFGDVREIKQVNGLDTPTDRHCPDKLATTICDLFLDR